MFFENDRTFCWNDKCKHTKCYRHQANVVGKPRYLSLAMFEGTKECIRRTQMTLIDKNLLLTEARGLVSDDAFGAPRMLKLIEDAIEVYPLEEFEELIRRQDMPITIPAILETKAYKELKRKYGECKP